MRIIFEARFAVRITIFLKSFVFTRNMWLKGNKSVAPRRDRSMWKCNYDAQTNRLLTDRITSDQQKNQPTNRQTDRIIGKLRLILTAMKRNERTILPPRYVYSLNTLSLIGFIIPIAKVYLNRQQSWNCWNCCWHKTAAVAFSSFSLLRQTYRTHAKYEAFDKLSLSSTAPIIREVRFLNILIAQAYIHIYMM